MKILLVFFMTAFFLVPSISWSVSKKVKILNKYELKKMGTNEREYYLKRLVQIFSNFERMENKRMKNKFAANEEYLNFSILKEAFAAESYNSDDNCIVGGRVVARDKNTSRCKLSKYKNKCTPKSGKRESGKSYYSCGPIYGDSCVVYENNNVSSACARHFSLDIKADGNYDNTLRTAKALYKELCGKSNSNNDGCNYLYESLDKLSEVADMMKPESYVNRDCPTGKKNTSNVCIYCYSFIEKVGRVQDIQESRVCHDYKDLVNRHKVLPQDLKDLTNMLELGLTTTKLGRNPDSIKKAIKDLRQGNNCNEFVNKRSVLRKRYEKDKKTISTLNDFINNKAVCKSDNSGGDPFINSN